MSTFDSSSSSGSTDVPISEVLSALTARAKWIAVAVAVGAALGALGWLVLPREYQAEALIRIGEVGQAGVGAPPMMVEAPNNAAARMRLDAFEDVTLQALGVSIEDSPQSRLFRRSLTVTNVKDTNLLEVKVRGYSREEARRFMAQIVSTLATAHEEIASPSISRLRAERERVVRELEAVARERAMLSDAMQERRALPPGTRFSENMVFIGMLAQKDTEFRQLDSQRLQFDEQLNPARTFPTSTINEIYVHRRHVFPRGSLFIGGGSLAGFVIGIAVVLVTVARTRS